MLGVVLRSHICLESGYFLAVLPTDAHQVYYYKHAHYNETWCSVTFAEFLPDIRSARYASLVTTATATG